MTSVVQQISEKPASTAVTTLAPNHVKQADLERKLKIVDVVEAFRDGKLPSNDQIDAALTYANTNPALDTSKLSPQGQVLIEDCKRIIEDARQVILKKNSNHHIQNFIYHTTKTEAGPGSTAGTGQAKDQVRDEAGHALRHLRTIGKLVITNAEFRKLVMDAQYIFRDILADSASSGAKFARPEEEKLSQVDRPAREESFDESHDEENMLPTNGNTDDNSHITNGYQSSPTESASKFKEKFQKIIPEEHRGKAKDYLREKFPQERRDQFIQRVKKMVAEIQKHPDYQEAVDFFISISETFGTHATSGATNRLKNLRSDPNWSQAERELREILENFANDKSMQPMIDAYERLWEDAQHDHNLQELFTDWNEYIRKLMKEEGYVVGDESTEDGKKLVERSQKLLGENYRSHTDNLLNQTRDFIMGMGDDPVTKSLGEDMKNLWRDLLYDESGHYTYKPALWEDVRTVILPSIFDQIRFIPIPRIEYSDREFDVVIENLILELENLLPNMCEVYNDNYFKLSMHKEIKDVNNHVIRIKMSQIQAVLRDVRFYYQKKNGFLLEDEGVADVILSGNGLSIDVKISTAANYKTSTSSVFTVKKCKAKVSNLNFKIRQSRHQILYTILRPIAMMFIKRRIAKGVEDAIRSGFEKLDSQIVEVNRRVEKAKTEDDTSKMSVVKAVFIDEPKKQAAKRKEHEDRKIRILYKRDSQSTVNGDYASTDWHDPRFNIVSKA